jgi:UDP-GlcNAc:undecaprenyl-phosphate GlcNAc-1-phosphate transferase
VILVILANPKLAGYAAPLACAALLSAALTHTVRNIAVRRGWTCRSLTHRDIHEHPIPRLGGVAIFASFVAVALLFGSQFTGLHLLQTPVAALLGAAALVFALGLWDDIWGARVWQKFAVEIGAAAVLYFNGFRILKLPLLFGSHRFGLVVAFLLTTFWVVLVTNAFNLIDGLDGLASGSALFSLVVLFVVSLHTTHQSVSFLAIVLIGATLGFLRFNFSPASIFLGDAGSLLLGFMVSALALAGAEKSVVAIVIPLVSFALPVLDTILAVVRRFLSGKPLFAPDREHIHHKLLEKGLSQRTAAVVLYCVSATFGLISLSLLRPTYTTMALASAMGAGLLAVGINRLGYYEFAELGLAARRILAQKQTIARNVAMRHNIDDLNRAASIAEICPTLTSICSNNGFDRLQVTVESEHEFTAEIAPMVVDSSGRLSFSCARSEQPHHAPCAIDNAPLPAQTWMLTFELGSAEHRRSASLTAYASCSPSSAPCDVSLLTNEFRTALGDAVERALARCQLPPSRPVRQPATQAGPQKAAA